MDVTVSITDHRCLAQSSLITRMLHTTVQIGHSSHVSETVLVQDAKFSSGTVEDPIIISLTNGPTHTVMFVRNIPMSTVQEMGTFEDWVAVYPPGDPQNLFFDATATVREGCPQVHLRVTIVDIASTTHANSMSLQDFRLLPPSPTNCFDTNSMRAESDGHASSAIADGSQAAGPATLQEKQRQAQQIKEHLAQFSRARQMSESASQGLKDGNLTLDSLKKQLRGVETQIAEAKASITMLEHERDEFLAEEAGLQEEIKKRDVILQDLRKARDKIDSDLGSALGERERQKLAVQTSSNNYDLQKQALAVEEGAIEKQVAQLNTTLANRKSMVADMELRALQAEQRRLAEEASRTKELTSNLETTLRDLATIRAQGADHERQCQDVDITKSDLRAQLAGLESEMAAMKEKDVLATTQRGKDQVVMLQNQAISKRAKLQDHMSKVQVLEEELRKTREGMIERGVEITEVTSKVTEADVRAKETRGSQDELTLRLDIADQTARIAGTMRQTLRSELETYETELEAAETACREQEAVAAAASDRRGSKTRAIEVGVSCKREELERLRLEAEALREDHARLSRRASLVPEEGVDLSTIPELLDDDAKFDTMCKLKGAIRDVQAKLRSAKEDAVTQDIMATPPMTSSDPLGESRRLIVNFGHVVDKCAKAGEADALPGSRAAIARGIQGRASELEQLEKAVQMCQDDLDRTRSQAEANRVALYSVQASLSQHAFSAELDEAQDRSRQERGEEAESELRLKFEECQRDMHMSTIQISHRETELADLQQSLEAAADADGSAAAEAKRRLAEHAGHLQRANDGARAAAERTRLADARLQRHLQAGRLQMQVLQNGLLGADFAQGWGGGLAAICTGLRTTVGELEAHLHEAEASAKAAKTLEADAKGLPAVRASLQHRQDELVARKDAEILQYAEQIEFMEEERQLLAEQLAEMVRERETLEGGVNGHKHARLTQEAEGQSTDESSQRRLECEVLEGEVLRMREIARNLEERRERLVQMVSACSNQENSLRQQLASLEEQSRQLQRRRECAQSSMSLELEKEDAKFGMESETLAEKDQLIADMQMELQRLQDEIRMVGAEGASVSTAAPSSPRRSRTVIRHLSDGAPLGDASEVPYLEERVQCLGDNLAAQQDEVWRTRAVEKELRSDVDKIRDRISELAEKMSHQAEHDSFQYDAVRKLEDRKRSLELEVDMLAFGYREADQRFAALQHENAQLLKDVEHLYEGCAELWLSPSADMAREKAEILIWKERAEKSRDERLAATMAMARAHEETVEKLRLEIEVIRQEVSRRKATVHQLEQLAMSKHSQGVRSLFVIPGQLCPMRQPPSFAHRRKALLVGINYTSSYAPLKGCVNDVWNMRCMLRHTLQYSEEQVRVLVDGPEEEMLSPEQLPTKVNILEGLCWLTAGALPGDVLLLFFAGYGTQQPRSPGDNHYEAHLVPCDFAADIPPGVMSRFQARQEKGVTTEFTALEMEQCSAGYRLLPLIELRSYFMYLPKACRATLLIDSCYGLVSGISTASNFPSSFPKVERGNLNYSKVRDFIIRPRFLELPALSVSYVPPHFRNAAFPSSWLHCFSACSLAEWSSEFPIEGTVQGAFTWMFLKALARNHFHCGIFQVLKSLGQITGELKKLFQGIEQSPVLQLSEPASVNDVVLWT